MKFFLPLNNNTEPNANINIKVSAIIDHIREPIEIIIAKVFPVKFPNNKINKPSLAPIPAGMKKAKKPAKVEIAKVPDI